MVLLTHKEFLEMFRLERIPGQSLDSYIQETIDYWILLTDYEVKFRNFFLEEVLPIAKGLPENEVNMEPFYGFERYSQWVFMKQVFKNNTERIKSIENEVYSKFNKEFTHPIDLKRFKSRGTPTLKVDSVLNLSNLKITDKKLKKYISVIYKQISKVYFIPDVLANFFRTTKYPEKEITKKLYILNEILLNDNKLTEIPKFEPYTNSMKKFTRLIIDLEQNNIPIEDFSNIEEFYGNKVIFRFQGNEGFPFRKLDSKRISEYKASNGSLYKIYTIPKNTLIFRQYHAMENIHYSFIGYPAGEDNDFPKDKYYLLPDHRSYFTLEPRFKAGQYGPVDVVMILQKDMKLIVDWFGGDAYSKEACPEKQATEVGADTCMFEEFRQNGINGWIAEPFGSEEGGPSIALWMIPLLNYMPHFTSQIMIHPTQNNEEIITDFSTVDIPEKMERYLEENMYRFNYKPLKVFDEKATREEYIEFIKDILSKKGWTDSDGNIYKAKMNPIDGIYKLL